MEKLEKQEIKKESITEALKGKFFSLFKGEQYFSPSEELKKIKKQIRNAPEEKQSSLRRQLILDFHRKIFEGAIKLKEDLENLIQFDPDIPPETLFEKIEEKAKEYSLSEEQTEKFKKSTEDYCRKQETIGNYISQYQEKFGPEWQKEFFKAQFGEYSLGSIKLEQGPGYLIWLCDDPRDFTLIITGKQTILSNLPGGILKDKVNLPGLEDSVIGLNLSFYEKQKYKEDGFTLEEGIIHERQHNLFSLIAKYFKTKEVVKELPEGLKKSFFSESKNNLDQYAQNEILAYSKKGISFDQIKEIFKLPQYKYFNEEKITEKLIEQSFAANFLIDRFTPIYQNMVDEIKKFVSQEKSLYQERVEKALEAAEKISKIPPYDDRNKLVSLLSLEPLNRWPKLAWLLSG